MQSGITNIGAFFPNALNTGNPDLLLGNRIPNSFWILLRSMHNAGPRKRTCRLTPSLNGLNR